MEQPSQSYNGDFLPELLGATTAADVESILDGLAIVPPDDYVWNRDTPQAGWRDGFLHWIPVGRVRNNAGRIKLGGEPINPFAERLINCMEAVIELERQKELRRNPAAAAPKSPRDAVSRYFGLPPLDSIPRLSDREKKRNLEQRLRDIRSKLRFRLRYEKQSRQFAVSIEDEGIGQAPPRIHETLLSLGESDKGDKPYMIGLFGQGGSSAYAGSTYSIVVSKRARGIDKEDDERIGWSVVKQIVPKNRRDPYFAYLADSPTGRVPVLPKNENSAFFDHGTTFLHVGYDFGSTGSAITRTLYPALNHIIFSPILPYELYALKDAVPMYGTAHRLARQISILAKAGESSVLDKKFNPQPVGTL